VAGKHASSAPVLLPRAVVTVLAAAVLLVVGVVAAIVLFGGDGSNQPGATPTGAPRTAPTSPPTPQTETTSEPGPVAPSTTVASTGSTPASSSSSTALTTTPQRLPTSPSVLTPTSETWPPRGKPTPLPTPPGRPTTPAPRVAPLMAPSAFLPCPGRGWEQRSDAGRAHGRALGILGRRPHLVACRLGGGAVFEVPGSPAWTLGWPVAAAPNQGTRVGQLAAVKRCRRCWGRSISSTSATA
jgi:hypothetical protein